MNIFTHDYFVLSGCTCLTDGRRDGQTDVDSKVRSNEVRCAQKSVPTLNYLHRDKRSVSLAALLASSNTLPPIIFKATATRVLRMPIFELETNVVYHSIHIFSVMLESYQ